MWPSNVAGMSRPARTSDGHFERSFRIMISVTVRATSHEVELFRVPVPCETMTALSITTSLCRATRSMFWVRHTGILAVLFMSLTETMSSQVGCTHHHGAGILQSTCRPHCTPSPLGEHLNVDLAGLAHLNTTIRLVAIRKPPLALLHLTDVYQQIQGVQDTAAQRIR